MDFYSPNELTSLTTLGENNRRSNHSHESSSPSTAQRRTKRGDTLVALTNNKKIFLLVLSMGALAFLTVVTFVSRTKNSTFLFLGNANEEEEVHFPLLLSKNTRNQTKKENEKQKQDEDKKRKKDKKIRQQEKHDKKKIHQQDHHESGIAADQNTTTTNGQDDPTFFLEPNQDSRQDKKVKGGKESKHEPSSDKNKKHRHKKDNEKHPTQYHGNMACLEDENYSTHTAKMAYEMPFAALFKDTRGEKKFEASSIFNLNGTYYAVCDNSWAISKFESSLTPFSHKNIMIGEPNREEGEDSGYEAIFFYNDTFYVVRESVLHGDATDNNSTYHAIIQELIITGDDYEVKEQCSCEFEFEGDSKGFEGAFGMEGVDGELYVIGLCEGNYCSESRKKEKGHGQIVLMKKNDCLWQTLKVIDIPSTAYFTDYSDISIRSNGKVAITTQEDSAVWIGQLNGIHDGKLNPGNLTFDENVHEVYYFPKSHTCETIYCNVEGVTFINDDMLMVVSDQMKKGGKQPYWCLEKDQSIHAFVLP